MKIEKKPRGPLGARGDREGITGKCNWLGTNGQAPTLAGPTIDVPPVGTTHAQLATVATCLFEPDDIVEVRRLPGKRSTWCRADELAGQVGGLARENRGGQNVFIGANPRTAKGGASTEDVSLARSIFSDFDSCELPDARRRIDDASLPAPTLLVRSGGGVHAYWRLSDAMTDLSLWTRYQRGLAALLDSDGKVCDAPRIMRVPGFDNLKYQPPRPCEIVESEPNRVYDVAEFADALDAVATKPAAAARGDADGTIGEGSRNDTLASLGGYLRRGGFGETEIRAALIEVNARRCDPALPDSEIADIAASVAKYESDQIAQAGAENWAAKWLAPVASIVESVPPWKPFPVDALPDVLRAFVVEQSAALPCDPVMVAVPALATCGAAIGLSRRVRAKSTWAEWPVIWSVVVAHSGTLKSPAFDAALEPLRKIQEARFRQHDVAAEIYDTERKTYEADFADWKRPPKKGAARGEPPAKPDAPTCVRHVVQDCTIESLAPVLCDNPRGVLVARDELSGWLGSFNQYKGGKGSDVANWLESHRAGALTVDRKSAVRPVLYIPHGAISVTGSIQPSIIRMALTPELRACGLAPRLLMACPPRMRKRWTDDDVSPATKRGYADTILALGEIELPMVDGVPEPADLRLSPAAQANWRTYYNRFAGEQDEAPGSLASTFSKIEGYALRLALIFELVKSPTATVVGADSLHHAIRVADWFAYEARRLYVLWDIADDDDGADPLVALIRSRGGKITARELSHASRQYQPVDVAKAAIQGLVDANHGRWNDPAPGAHGGAPTRVFELISTDIVTITPRSDPESGVLVMDTVDTVQKHEKTPEPLRAVRTQTGQWE